MDEFEAKGLPKEVIVKIITNESTKPNIENEYTEKD